MADALNLNFLKRSKQGQATEEPTPTGVTSEFIIPKKKPSEAQVKQAEMTREQEALAKRGGVERFLLGAGSRIGDIGLGAMQTAGMISDLFPGEPSTWPQEVSEAVRAGAPYRAAIAADPMASVGRAGVDVAASLIPGARALPQMLTGAALAGPFTPREDPTLGDVLFESGKGAVFGGLGAAGVGAASKTIGKTIGAARGAVADPDMARRLALSREHFVPLSLGDITQYPGIKSIENTLALLPFNKRLPFLQEQADIMKGYAESLPESILRPMQIASKEDTGKAIADSIKRQYGTQKANARVLYEDVAKKVKQVGDPPVTPTGLRDTAIQLKDDYPDIFNAFQDKQAVSRLNSIIKGTKPRDTGLMDATGNPITTPAEVSFDDMRWLDKRLGGMIRQGRSQMFAGKMDPNAFEQLTSLQGALRKDIDDWSTNIGQPEIADAWKTANKYFRENVVPFRETPVIKDVIRNPRLDTDKLPGRLFRPDSPTSVLQHKQFMTPQGIDAGRSYLLQDIRKKTLDPAAEAGYSPSAFIRAADLGETGPKMFSADELGELGDLSELMKVTSRAAEPLDIGSYRAISTILGRTPMIPMLGRGMSNVLQSPTVSRFVVAPSEIAPGGLGRMIENAARRTGMGAGLETMRTEDTDYPYKKGGLTRYNETR